MKLEVRASTLLALAVEDVIGARSVLRGHTVDVLSKAHNLAAALVVELQRALGSGVGATFLGGVA
jgi:hypothetical protein